MGYSAFLSFFYPYLPGKAYIPILDGTGIQLSMMLSTTIIPSALSESYRKYYSTNHTAEQAILLLLYFFLTLI